MGVFVFGVLFNFTRWFELEVLEIEDPIDGNKTIVQVPILKINAKEEKERKN